jgi:hypothetical protein
MPLSYGPPDPKLARELQQVANAARDVTASLAELNNVPRDFPSAALLDLCAALVAVPDGTAENCRPQLELARNMLPKIRREHFDIEQEQIDSQNELPVPRLERGMMLDQKINILLATVTTALDEYRAQVSSPSDDPVRPEDVAVPTTAARKGGIEAQTEEVVGRIREGVAQLDAHRLPETEAGDLLRRRLQDGQNLALAARSQLRQRTTVVRWFDGVVLAFRRTPDLIEGAGKALRTGANAAEPLGHWLVDYLTEWVGTTVRLARGLGDALEECARQLRGTSRAGGLAAESDLKDLAKLALAGLPISDDDDRPGRLRIDATRAMSNESLAECDAVLRRLAPRITAVSLAARGPAVTEVGPLARLTSVESLDLSGNRIKDLSPLRTMRNLKRLNLANNSMSPYGNHLT